jgi:hypothetical protein
MVHVYKLDSSLGVLAAKFLIFGDNTVFTLAAGASGDIVLDEPNDTLFTFWTSHTAIYVCKQVMSTLVASSCVS